MLKSMDTGYRHQPVSQTAVCDTRARTPSDERRRVSYPVSDSMSCIRLERVPVPGAERARRSARTDGLGDRAQEPASSFYRDLAPLLLMVSRIA